MAVAPVPFVILSIVPPLFVKVSVPVVALLVMACIVPEFVILLKVPLLVMFCIVPALLIAPTLPPLLIVMSLLIVPPSALLISPTLLLKVKVLSNFPALLIAPTSPFKLSCPLIVEP